MMVCYFGTACLDFGESMDSVGGGASIMRLGPTTFLFVILSMHSLIAVSRLGRTARPRQAHPPVQLGLVVSLRGHVIDQDISSCLLEVLKACSKLSAK